MSIKKEFRKPRILCLRRMDVSFKGGDVSFTGHVRTRGERIVKLAKEQDMATNNQTPDKRVSFRSHSTPSPVISVQGVSKTFRARDGSRVVALENCSLDLADGEFVCIVGPSGCGKTTLLRIIAELLQPTKGTVTFHGNERNIGMVFQRPVLLPWRTNLDNVLLPIEFNGQSKRKFADKAKQLLDLVGLGGFEDKYPYELSGGMQQRVAISRALVSDPKILLMDEPFGALDALTRGQMNVELLRIWQEAQRSVIFITHSISEAIFLADRVLVMASKPGRVVSDIRVNLPRPRVREHRHSDEFGRHEASISELLGVDAAG